MVETGPGPASILGSRASLGSLGRACPMKHLVFKGPPCSILRLSPLAPGCCLECLRPPWPSSLLQAEAELSSQGSPFLPTGPPSQSQGLFQPLVHSSVHPLQQVAQAYLPTLPHFPLVPTTPIFLDFIG